MRRERHGRGGNRLVASHYADHGVEHLPAANQFNGIGDQFAAHQRSAHAFGAHGFAIGDRDGIEFHGSAAGGANAFFHFGREPPQVKVARHGFDPGVGHADQRLAKIGVGEADGFEHGARRSPVAPVGDSAAAMLKIHEIDYKDYMSEEMYPTEVKLIRGGAKSRKTGNLRSSDARRRTRLQVPQLA